MTDSVPFSITPDAENFLRNRINLMPHEAHPVLMMATSQSDGLKSPRWFYEGESFVIDYFDPKEKPEIELSKFYLFGRSVGIEPSALKSLSGHFLNLRKVDASRGLLNVARYVLVAGSTPEPLAHARGENVNTDNIKRGLAIGSLTILGGFTGMGVFWIISGFIALTLGIPEEKLFQLKVIYFLFLPGWILGAIVSFLFFRSVYKADGKTKFEQEQKQRKYLGYGGLQAQVNGWTFFGIPASLMAILIWVLLPFAHTDTQKAYGTVVLLMIVFGGSMYFCDKMPRRFIMRLGLLGWAITLVLGYFYFKIHGP
jgi:MFS family permease